LGVVRWLVKEAGCPIRPETGLLPLFEACRYDQLEVARWLVAEAGTAAFADTCVSGNSALEAALMEAGFFGPGSVVWWLIEEHDMMPVLCAC
jgi:hypothetical protein